MIRPEPARWFEILAARDDATLALEALARTGMVELQARPAGMPPAPLEAMQPLLAEFAELAARYHVYWPQTGLICSAFPHPPTATLQRSLDVLRQWARQAEPAIHRLQAAAAERLALRRWQQLLAALPRGIDFARLAQAGVLRKRLLVFPGGPLPEWPPQVLTCPVDNDDGSSSVLAVGTRQAVLALEQQAAAQGGRGLEPPGWLVADTAQNALHISARQQALGDEEWALRALLDRLLLQHDVHRALGDAYRVQWLMANVRALESTALFCWVTGWTSDIADHRLRAALEASGARSLLHFPATPTQLAPPLLLVNPWWARPFEIFCRALGMPSRNEVDASVLLALAVPLMFGYMFADVGQGLVIALIGFLLRKRFVVARLLVAGGLSAAVFGVLFGSVFSTHALLEPLWLAPLEAPLTVLWVPLAGGVVLLLIGLLLHAAQARWRGQLGRWLATDAGLVVAYVALLASPFVDEAVFVALAGTALFLGGHARQAAPGGRLAAALAALAEFIERLIQLLINTLSFARVGAFALAHAGLSSAVVVLMAASANAVTAALVLLLGNVLIMTLEVMVVSIQTTRLVLFEFFTRFLTADGRVFRPLTAPASTHVFQET